MVSAAAFGGLKRPAKTTLSEAQLVGAVGEILEERCRAGHKHGHDNHHGSEAGPFKQPFPRFVQDHFRKKYGVRKVAAKNFFDFLRAVDVYAPNHRRVELFAALLGLRERAE